MGSGHIYCLKATVIIVNILFMLLGAVMLAGGLFIAMRANDTFKDAMGESLNAILMLPKEVNLLDMLDGAVPTSVDGLAVDVGAILKSVYVALICIGCIILTIATIGAMGACCSNKSMMIIYIVVTGLLFLAELILVILLFTGVLTPHIKWYLKDMIRHKYVGIDDFSAYSLAFNYLMVEFECCGVDSYEDFQDSTSWHNIRRLPSTSGDVRRSIETPVACCKMSGDFPNVQIIDNACLIAPTVVNSNWKTGCYDAVQAYLAEYKDVAYGTAVGVLLFQLLIFVLSTVTEYILERYESGNNQISAVAK